jgi:thiol-disulfide isomerase/thioredoxin
MAKTKKESKATKKVDKSRELYYFYSQGCGWCKRTEPLIDELNKEGYNILKLDLADGDNKKLQEEVKKEYNAQCGTPWLIDPETGNQICGFREKDIIQKWADGEEIPTPPRPKGPPPRPPFMGAPKKEETQWTKDYNKWLKENDHLPKEQKKSAKEVLEMPRPKSQPPGPPPITGGDDELDKWGDVYQEWADENNHLPNLQPKDVILQRVRQQRAAQQQQSGANVSAMSNLNGGKTAFMKNLNTSFHYVVEDGEKVEIHADEDYIKNLKQQYYFREVDGRLTKVVGDSRYDARQSQRVKNTPINPPGKPENDNDRLLSKKNKKEKTVK